MAKVLLINSNRFRHPWPVIPFGLCYIAAVLDTVGKHKVFLLDLCFSRNCEEDIRKAISNSAPDVIGITIRNIDDTGGYHIHFLLEDVKKDVINYCKKEFSGPIVIGGPSVGISGREMLEYFDLEYAVRGDGENVMLNFVNRIESGLSLEGLDGLIIRRETTIIQDDEPFRIQDLDSIPFANPHRYMNLEKYRLHGSPVLVQTKRGCAFNCSYCTYNQIEGKQYRLRNPLLVADELEILVKETGITHVEFADSIFNVPLAHSKEVLKAVTAKNLDLKLHTMGLTPAAVDEELLDLMKYAGFNEVDIGVESACDIVLRSLSKDFRLSDIIRTATLLKKKKIPATWFVMLGSPVETFETVMETFATLRRIISKWDLVFVSTGIRIYNGSPFAKQLNKRDIHYSDSNFFHPVKIEPEKISLEEIHKIAKRFSFRYPNFYLYEKENITPGWLLITGTILLKIFRSRQPVWRLLILLRKIESVTGIRLIKRIIYELKRLSMDNKSRLVKGFSLINLR